MHRPRHPRRVRGEPETSGGFTELTNVSITLHTIWTRIFLILIRGVVALLLKRNCGDCGPVRANNSGAAPRAGLSGEEGCGCYFIHSSKDITVTALQNGKTWRQFILEAETIFISLMFSKHGAPTSHNFPRTIYYRNVVEDTEHWTLDTCQWVRVVLLFTPRSVSSVTLWQGTGDHTLHTGHCDTSICHSITT